jgi:predicted  nucleic acid-binding Zn-ribbon protein
MNTLNNLDVILGFQLVMGLPEIIICELGALILGFTIHFFWNSKKSLRISDPSANTGISENDNWKLKYYNDMDMQERSHQQLRDKLAQAQENEQILSIELEETRRELEDLKKDLEDARIDLEEAGYRLAATTTPPVAAHEGESLSSREPGANHQTTPNSDYLSQLKAAQEKLVEHNNSIYRLLEHTQLLGEAEKKNQDLQRQNEQLNEELRSSGQLLVEKESEISYLRHQQKLAEEMSLRLDKAYDEYNSLQEKLQKLQGYLTQPHKKSADYEELKDTYFKLGKEHDEMKLRHISLREENQRLSRILADTEEKLKEANFQRQQFQKRSAFLEELNHDLQEISEHNKKIESQLRRVSDMETLLAKITGSANEDLHNE